MTVLGGEIVKEKIGGAELNNKYVLLLAGVLPVGEAHLHRSSPGNAEWFFFNFFSIFKIFIPLPPTVLLSTPYPWLVFLKEEGIRMLIRED